MSYKPTPPAEQMGFIDPGAMFNLTQRLLTNRKYQGPGLRVGPINPKSLIGASSPVGNPGPEDFQTFMNVSQRRAGPLFDSV